MPEYEVGGNYYGEGISTNIGQAKKITDIRLNNNK